MAEIFDTLLLLALPASGKSEVRTYLTEKSPETFHMGPTVQIDDYPYVHFELRMDEELVKRGRPHMFHAFTGGPFKEGFDWGALVGLLDEDYQAINAGSLPIPSPAAPALFERIDRASVAAGGTARIAALPDALRAELAHALEADARKVYEDVAAVIPDSLEGKTIVIEFARGGPMNTRPLPPGYGYAGSLPNFSAALLERAAVLYIWVDPHESRRKNRARARPDGDGSILFHGTPEPVMYEEYGRCDMDDLEAAASAPDTIPIHAHGRVFHLPMARFDNRVDKTSFLRDDPADWSQADIEAIHGGLTEACARLWAAVSHT